jgi:hypothetical protein
VSQKRIAAAGNTVVPALIALEQLGFRVNVSDSARGENVVASRDNEEYVADDPVAVLGLIKLTELRQWTWQATDQEIEITRKKYHLG